MGLSVGKGSLTLGGALGFLAFITVFIVALFSGVSFFSMLMRSLIAGLVLGVLGFGLGFLIESFVPDAWSAPAGNAEELSGGEDSGSAGGDSVVPLDGETSALDYTIGEDAGPSDLAGFPGAPSGIGEPAPGPSPRKAPAGTQVIGNTRIINDIKFKDEPEEYAKAIRSMMQKDDE